MTNKSKGVLADHKREGKRLIPPMMRLTNIVETSFRDTKIPELVWISALFKRASNKHAADGVIEFLVACQKAIADDEAPHLSFLSNFNSLPDRHKQLITSDPDCARRIPFLQHHLWHQHALLDRYPLAFIFPNRPEFDRAEAIRLLKEDVEALLDRYTPHATKVQTTAVFAQMATGKMFIHESIDFPDPNTIFTKPESDEAKRVASFVRASLNAGADMVSDGGVSKTWTDDFWAQTFVLEGCQ